MKKLGIVGGIGPESTIDYYKLLIARYRELVTDGSYPRIIINSLDLSLPLEWLTNGELEKVADYLVEALQDLDRSGSDFAILAANSAHVVFEDVASRSPLPLISIVDAARDNAKHRGLKRLGLFGTNFTMSADFFPDAFSRENLELVVPASEERAWIHERYIGELLVGNFTEETREGLLQIAERMVESDGIDGLLLAGTELPLTLRRESHAGVPFLDTTKMHVERTVEALLA